MASKFIELVSSLTSRPSEQKLVVEEYNPSDDDYEFGKNYTTTPFKNQKLFFHSIDNEFKRSLAEFVRQLADWAKANHGKISQIFPYLNDENQEKINQLLTDETKICEQTNAIYKDLMKI